MSDSLRGIGGPRWTPADRGRRPVGGRQAQRAQYRGREVAAQPARAQLPNAARTAGPAPTPYRPLPQRNVQLGSGAGAGGLREAARFTGLPSRGDLESVAGRPKNDIKFWFFGTRTIHRSTAYKELLNKIDDWHARAAAPAGQEGQQRLAELDDQLRTLGRAAEECVGKGSRSRRAAINELIGQVAERQSGAEALSASAARGDALPADVPVAQMIGYASAGVPVGDMAALSRQGVSAQQAAALSQHISLDVGRSLAVAGLSGPDFIGYLATGPESAPALLQGLRDQPDAYALINDFKQANLSAEQLSGYLNNGITPQNALVYHRGELPYNLNAITADHLLPRTPDAEVKFTQKDVVGALEVLGAGAANQVYSAPYADGETRIFKPLPTPSHDRSNMVELGWIAFKTGIDPFVPQTAMRNVATCKLADALGFDVVAKTELGVLNAPPPGNRGAVPLPQHWQPQLGLVMDLAPGKSGDDIPLDWYAKPGVRQELTKLQLLDALTGQGDRHDSNYFIQDLGQGRFKVTGIDNDQCFGMDLLDPNGICQGSEEDNMGFKSCRLPGLIDSDMAASIERLQPGDLDQALGGTLSPEEVDAAKARLEGVKRHVADLRDQGAVMNIPPDSWDRGVRVGVGNRKSPESYNSEFTSYFVRDPIYRALDAADAAAAAAAP